ncbi:thiamine-phosphate kinase [uncultured Erythrobacter sp.]|uniref:thiamine-phosphate kinase n=1 Tax=uncultured Erythrobacter sp. TaxID=263913 RepID=UPI00260DEAD8|nr:thiamine-phosphate kinase [uncultured Erythrobacter sp.]
MRGLALHEGARGLEDDCAVLEIGGETLVFTHDTMAEGTHFRPDADMADVAWKLVASNLSDLAAKGAEPIGVLLGHCLGRDDVKFLAGLKEALDTFNVKLLGGDTIAARDAPILGLTAIGRATHSPVPSRGGAGVDDDLYVTGTLGRALLGFQGMPAYLEAFNRPTPLLAEGRALAPHVTAMMDISDGLLLDAFRLAKASGVTLAIETSAVPIADVQRREDAMRWGDDYELLFTLRAGADTPIKATRIGQTRPLSIAPLMLDEHPVMSIDGLGYQHG